MTKTTDAPIVASTTPKTPTTPTAPIISKSSNYKFAGCFVDQTFLRDLPYRMIRRYTYMTNEVCAKHCTDFPYFGTQVTVFINFRLIAFIIFLHDI